MTRRASAVALLAGLLLAACAAVVPGTAVGPEEVQQALVGRTLKMRLFDGSTATERLDPGGTVLIAGALNDRGRWHLWERGYCTAWTRIGHGAERCFVVERTPDGHYRVMRTTGELMMTVVAIE